MQNIPLINSPEITKTLLSISLTLLIAIICDNIFRSLIKVPKNFENRRSRTYISFLKKTITVVIYIITVNFILIEIGINVTPFLASASIIGIVVGIGARALIEDLINGIFLLTQDTIAIGDNVKIDDTEGKIEKMGFRSLTIRADGGEVHVIPNGLVKKVINFPRQKLTTFVDFPVRSDQDIDLTIKSLEDALTDLKHDKQLKDSILEDTRVLGITDFKLEGRMVLRAKIATSSELRFTIVRKYRYLVKKQFEKNKIALI